MSLTAPRTPTGVDELTPIRTISPAPEQLRVSVSGATTQVDITLPATVRVADIVPYLVQIITDHERTGDEPVSVDDERTTRNVLSRDGQILSPPHTLRQAGVRDGDVLTLTAEPTLHPPTRYDDVVDAAAHLNRAAYAAWGPASAAVMAVLALWVCVGILGWMSLDSRFDPARAVIAGLDVAGALAVLTAAAVAQRMYQATRIAAVFGWAAVVLATAAVTTPAGGIGAWGTVATCGVVVMLSYGAYRLIGTGVGGFVGASVLAVIVGVTVAGRTVFGVADHRVGVAVCLSALLLAGAVPRLTVGWDRFELRTGPGPDERGVLEDPFGRSDRDSVGDRGLVETVPSADEVAARGSAAATLRTALYAGAGAALVWGGWLLAVPWDEPRWAVLIFNTLCAVVLAVRVRCCRSMSEQAGVLIPAAAMVVVTGMCTLAGPPMYLLAGLVGFGAGVAGGAAVGVLAMRPAQAARRRHQQMLLDYLGYVAAGALVPTAVAVLGWYGRLRGMWP